MTEGAGVARSARSLAEAGAAIAEVGADLSDVRVTSRAVGELCNLATTAASLLAAATLRTETRGAHMRSDHPESSPRWRRRILHSAGGLSLLDVGATGDTGDR